MKYVYVSLCIYLTAMKYAGIDITSLPTLGNFSNVSLLEDQLKQIEDWAKTVPENEEKESKDIVLEVSHADFAYDDTIEPKTLSDISFSIREGDMVSIVGSNGAGKSTLAKLICGFVRPTSGTVLIED